jgi:hypothetical protein
MSFNLNHFANTYVRTSFEIVGPDTCINLERFYEALFQKVSEKTKCSLEDIRCLHHAFHWSLFLREYSPLLMVSSGNASCPVINVQRGPAPWWRYNFYTGEIASRVIDENRGWLEPRVKKLFPTSD